MNILLCSISNLRFSNILQTKNKKSKITWYLFIYHHLSFTILRNKNTICCSCLLQYSYEPILKRCRNFLQHKSSSLSLNLLQKSPIPRNIDNCFPLFNWILRKATISVGFLYPNPQKQGVIIITETFFSDKKIFGPFDKYKQIKKIRGLSQK